MRRRLLGPLAMVGVMSTACGESTGPGDGAFDPMSAQAELQAVNGTFETPAFQSLGALADNLPAGMAPMVAGSVELLDEAEMSPGGTNGDRIRQATAQLRDAFARMSTGAPIPILQQYAGTRFVYNVAEGHYVVAESGEAPENGVRFVLYAVNPVTGDPAGETQEDLVEIGYADITDVNPESDDQVAARVMVVVEGTTFLDYTVTATLGGTSGIGGTVTAEGMLTDGETTAEFVLTHTVSVDFAGAEIAVSYDISVPERQFAVSLDLAVAGDQEMTVTTVTLRVSHEGDFVLMSGNFDEAGGEITINVGSGSGDGEPWAILTISPTGLSVTGADGGELTQDEIQALREIFEVVERVFEVFEDLFSPVEWAFSEQAA